MSELGYLTVVGFVLLCTLPVQSLPLKSATNEEPSTSVQTSHDSIPLQRSVFNSFEEVTQFLHTWFRRIRGYQRDGTSQASSSSESNHHETRHKRDVQATEEPTFEKYEQDYLINQTLIYLRQMYMFAEYKNNSKNENNLQENGKPGQTNKPPTDTDNGSRVSAILDDLKQRLERMSSDQLHETFRNVNSVARQGLEDLGEAISNLCCPYG